MKNSILTIILAVLLAGAAIYFFVLKKPTTNTGNTPTAPPLTEDEVKGLTDGQIQALTLDQIKALTFKQLGLLTPAQNTMIQSLKTQLQAKADADAKILAEKQRIEAIKAKMGIYTVADIDKLTPGQLTSFTDEELQILSQISTSKDVYNEVVKDKNYYDKYNSIVSGVTKLKSNSARLGELGALAKNIGFHFVSWLHATRVQYLIDVNALTDAELYYFVNYSYPQNRTTKTSFASDLHYEDSNGIDNASVKAGYTNAQKIRLIGELTARINLITYPTII